VWAALGALFSPSVSVRQIPGWLGGAALLAVATAAGLGAARSAGQLAGMKIYASSEKPAALEHAALLDPGNYRVHLLLARTYARGEDRCEHATAAHHLFPNAAAARSLSRGCK
jgi:hypothetical protein